MKSIRFRAIVALLLTAIVLESGMYSPASAASYSCVRSLEELEAIFPEGKYWNHIGIMCWDSIESRCQHRYRYRLRGWLIYRIWPACDGTQWSWQVARRYFPVPQSGNRVWNWSWCCRFDNYLFRGNRYQLEPQYHCNKCCRGYIWLCILPVHRFRKWLYHSGQLRISCVHVLLG